MISYAFLIYNNLSRNKRNVETKIRIKITLNPQQTINKKYKTQDNNKSLSYNNKILSTK